MPTHPILVEEWLRLIQAEFVEIRGLDLSAAEVAELWNLDTVMAEAILDALETVGFLRKTGAGRYVRASPAPGPRNGL
jgi:hypothetical protein